MKESEEKRGEEGGYEVRVREGERDGREWNKREKGTEEKRMKR